MRETSGAKKLILWQVLANDQRSFGQQKTHVLDRVMYIPAVKNTGAMVMRTIWSMKPPKEKGLL